ncbi:MAG: hypothetical protein ACKVS6_02090 [Planctomycetota bacterium]
MELPIQRVPPMVGPGPPESIPRLGERPRDRQQKFTLDEDAEESQQNEDASENEDDTKAANDTEDPDATAGEAVPPPPETGQIVDRTA